MNGIDQGITDIIDLRGEASHERFVAQHAPHIRYHWLGVDDEGDRRSDEWFEAIEAAAQLVLQDPSRKVVIHCHMGVNRGPSAAFTALITHGVDPIRGTYPNSVQHGRWRQFCTPLMRCSGLRKGRASPNRKWRTYSRRSMTGTWKTL